MFVADNLYTSLVGVEMGFVDTAVEVHHRLGFGAGEGLVDVLVVLGMQHGVARLVDQSNRREEGGEEGMRTRFR